MFRTKKLYTCMAVVLAVICIIFLSNCGGGGNSSVVPNTNPTTENPVSYTNPTPKPVLSNVNVSGYLYVNNTVTEDGETVPSISVLDVPACQSDSSGNESFLTQFSNSIKADYPEDWAKQDVQELYAQLNKTLSESKPLPEYNAQAQLCSAYDDTSIPVGSDGHFDNTVLTGATDSNVKLEVALGEDSYTEVETLPSSGSINSSDTTGAAVLKSCPEKIFAFPGEIIIFKVYSEPGINLKSAGLKFTLNNSSIGCITQPVYLCLFGAHKYQVAYGCVYIKHGLDTPVDTTITAKLNSGQSMSIFLEVIKKTASISGTVYTGGSPLVKGYVKSLGPKACCKIDASGQYSLPKVFRGHSRSVIATWWTSENGQKVRHREEKVIDFFNTDMAGFNFGVPPTPTPTATPIPITDTFCFDTSVNIMMQRDIWAQGSDITQAIQKTVQWLNGNVQNYPPPQGVASADVDEYDPTIIWINFTDGKSRSIHYYPIIVDNTSDSQDSVPKEFNKVYYSNLSNKATTVGSAKVKILAPFGWQDTNSRSVENAIWKQLKDAGYDEIGSVCKVTGNDDIKKHFANELTEAKYITDKALTDIANDNELKLNKAQKDTLKNLLQTQEKFDTKEDLLNKGLLHGTPGALFSDEEVDKIWNYMKNYSYCKMTCSINYNKPGTPNIIRPEDFQDLANYGIIYIATHGSPTGINLGPKYYKENGELDEVLKAWLDGYTEGKYFGDWNTCYVTVIDSASPYYKDKIPGVLEACELHASVFDGDFSKSLVYINACNSYNFIKQPGNPFSGAKAYLGYDRFAGNNWARNISYYFFLYMIDGYEKPIMIFAEPNSPVPEANSISDPSPLPSSNPMSVRQAIEAFSKVIYNTTGKSANPDPHNYFDTNKYPNKEVQQAQGCTLTAGYNTDPNEEIYFPVPVTITVEKK